VVLHEAVCAGLPVICSTACGAGDQFVAEGENGYLFESGDGAALTGAMVRMTQLPGIALSTCFQRSRALSLTVSPTLWAEALWQAMQGFRARR
jgi:glycosyltransferase involved in cell wall biosynthesis